MIASLAFMNVVLILAAVLSFGLILFFSVPSPKVRASKRIVVYVIPQDTLILVPTTSKLSKRIMYGPDNARYAYIGEL